MKKRGFTLIELLAVIVILAIIALIAVPTIINIIGNAQKSAFKNSAYGIIKAGELYYTDKMMEPEGMTEEKIFEFPEAVGLEHKGSKPTGGTLKVSKEGKVAIAINNGKYCVKKGYHENDITINEDLSDCTIPGASKTLSQIATTSQDLGVESIDDCATSGVCDLGTAFAIKVNSTTTYKFYVIADTGSEVTLIMDDNLGARVAWITQADYIAAGGSSGDYGSYGNTNKGPLTTLRVLNERTSNWTNIAIMNYTLEDDGSPARYDSISLINIRARLLTYTEATSLGCSGVINSCPDYLYYHQENDSDDICLSTTGSSESAYIIHYGAVSLHQNSVPAGSKYIRPVITLFKSL